VDSFGVGGRGVREGEINRDTQKGVIEKSTAPTYLF